MIETPNLQTVLTLTGGVSPLPQSVFVWGTASRAFSVGTHGDWAINAPGVAPVHFFLRFDGKMLHIAGGPSGAPLSVSGVVVDQTWRPLPVFSLVAFGGAQLRVTCEPAAPRPQSAPPVGVTAPVAPAPQQVLKPVDHLQSTVPLNDVRMNEVRRVRTEPVVLADAGQRVWPRSDPPAAGASPSYPPAAGPHPGATLVSPGAPQANMSEVPSVRRELPQTPAEMESTLSDSGALKEHAKRVASEPNLARASADAYLQAVRQQAGIQGSPPPPRTLEAARTEAQPLVPAAGSLPRAPSAPPVAAPPPQVPQEAEDASKAKGSKEKSSWVMRITLILLPFAGYFAIFWEPPAEAPPPPEVSVSTPTGSAPAVPGTASAPAASSTPSTPVATGGVPAPSASVAVGATPVANVPSTASGATASGSAAPSVVAPPVASEKGAATIEVGDAAVPINVNRPRDALNAALEGRLDEAIAHYDALATGPHAEVYSTAARLIRERAFRKP
jgi:hypothetical protein